MNVMILIVSFNNSISWADCIGAVSLLLALIGGYFALIQWRMNMKLKRAEYIKNLLDQMKTDKDIVYNSTMMSLGMDRISIIVGNRKEK